MSRQKDLFPSERVRIDGNRKRGGISSREQKTWEWIDAIPDGKRFDMVWDLITAAVNGELGVVRQTAPDITDEEDVKAEAALEALLNNMAIDEE